MTDQELKRSLEASNFISFLSILVCQKSLSDKALEQEEKDAVPIGDTGGKYDPLHHSGKAYLGDEGRTSFPNLEIRVSKQIMNKLRNSNIYKSIMSNGSIILNSISNEHLIGLNDSFNIEEYTHSNIRSSIDNIQSSMMRLSNYSTLRSNNRLALVLKKVQEQNLLDNQ